MILSMMGERVIRVSEETAQDVDQILNLPREQRPLSMKVPVADSDQPATLIVTTITGIWTDEQWDAMKREKRGEWHCVNGHWHTVQERWCQQETKRQPQPDFSELRLAPVDPEGPETDRQKWARLIQINNRKLIETKRYGTLRTLAELEAYDQDGSWPVEPERKGKTRWIALPKASPFPGDKPKYGLVEVAA